MDSLGIDRKLFMDHLFEMVLRRVAVYKLHGFLEIVYSIKTVATHYDEEDREYVYEDISVLIANILTNKIFRMERKDNETYYYISDDMVRDVRIKFYLDI